MSYANGTQFYNLPQTVGTDKRDWFDTNGAFAAVDAALHAAVTGQAADAEAISTINTSLAAAESDIASLQTASTTQASEISALQATVASQGTAITDVRQDAEDMISAFNEGAASVSTHAYAIGDYFIYNDVLYKATAAIAIGDTIVPNTNCSATNVSSEINVINGDIDDVKSDLPKLLLSSGVETYGTFGAKILTALSNLSPTDLCRIVLYRNGEVYHLSIYDSINNRATFFNVLSSTGEIRTRSYVITSNTWTLQDTATHSDNSVHYYTDSWENQTVAEGILKLIKS